MTRSASRPSSPAIVVLAKQPRPGRVKTRMCPPLTPVQAAELASAMLDDVLEATAGFAVELGLEPVLAVHPPSACSDLARRAPRAFRVAAQRGEDLSQRMDWAVREASAAGASRVLLRGSDSPALDLDRVAAALCALDRADLSVCPDRDGGYSLIGMHRPIPDLFAHPMSTRSVLDDTLAHARARGLRVELLAPCFDLDRIGDLHELARARQANDSVLCPRTLAFLDRQQLWPASR